jgi:DNA excision repair protein ERCC-6
MYNRQLYKQHLSQKVLKNPEQRRFFAAENLRDLFTYSPPSAGTTTGALFKGTETVYNQEDAALRKIAGVTGLAAQ